MSENQGQWQNVICRQPVEVNGRKGHRDIQFDRSLSRESVEAYCAQAGGELSEQPALTLLGGITPEMIKRAADALSEEIYATDQHRYKAAEAVLQVRRAGPPAP